MNVQVHGKSLRRCYSGGTALELGQSLLVMKVGMVPSNFSAPFRSILAMISLMDLNFICDFTVVYLCSLHEGLKNQISSINVTSRGKANQNSLLARCGSSLE